MVYDTLKVQSQIETTNYRDWPVLKVCIVQPRYQTCNFGAFYILIFTQLCNFQTFQSGGLAAVTPDCIFCTARRRSSAHIFDRQALLACGTRKLRTHPFSVWAGNIHATWYYRAALSNNYKGYCILCHILMRWDIKTDLHEVDSCFLIVKWFLICGLNLDYVTKRGTQLSEKNWMKIKTQSW
jgi:hypothetical protein